MPHHNPKKEPFARVQLIELNGLSYDVAEMRIGGRLLEVGISDKNERGNGAQQGFIYFIDGTPADPARLETSLNGIDGDSLQSGVPGHMIPKYGKPLPAAVNQAIERVFADGKMYRHEARQLAAFADLTYDVTHAAPTHPDPALFAAYRKAVARDVSLSPEALPSQETELTVIANAISNPAKQGKRQR